MRSSVLASLLLLAGCNNLLGISTPGLAGGDASVADVPEIDAPACPQGEESCSGSCVAVATSTEHCGACDVVCPTVPGSVRSCQEGLCRLDVDEAVHLAWTRTAPGPYLGFWKDGTLLASNGLTATSLITTGATPTVSSFTALASRHTIVIPSNPADPEVALSHYGFFEGRKQNDMQEWTNSVGGCCGTTPEGFTTDPVLGRMFTGHGIVEINTVTGATAKESDNQNQHGSTFYVTATALYLPRVNTANVIRFNRNHGIEWTTAISATAGVTIGPAAIAPDGGILVSSTAGDKLSRLQPNGARAWEEDVVSPGPPITTSTGSVIVGAEPAGVPNICAFDISNGDQRWCTPVAGSPVDLIAGDDGVIYAALENHTTVLGLDAASGAVRYTFRNLPVPQEMLLRGGRLYIYGGGAVTAIHVPAQRYDASSWPVRFHDNQRTRGTQATLDY